jgi:hypothetical protein
MLQITCGSAFGSRIVRQETQSLTTIDFDKMFIDDARARMNER